MGNGKVFAGSPPALPVLKLFVRVEMTLRDSSLDERTRSALVPEKIALLQRFIPRWSAIFCWHAPSPRQTVMRLIRCSLFKISRFHRQNSTIRKCLASQPLQKNSALLSRSNVTSVASMQRKKRLRLASSKRSTLNTG